jgi:hypothetical protein
MRGQVVRRGDGRLLISPPKGGAVRKILFVAAAALLAAASGASSAGAAPLTVSAGTAISQNQFLPGCGGPTEGDFPGTNFNYDNSEVEPWLAIRPNEPMDVAGMWQQDRWSDGGAHGLVAAVSHDGGQSFALSAPHFSICAGGTPANRGDYGRSSDPWVSWAPNGDLWSISLSVDRTTTRNAVLVSRMRHGESSWSEPTPVKFDTSRAGIPLGNNFNDKESLTADPNNADLVYAVWDRLVAPNENAPASAFETSQSFHGPTWFSRTTNGASASPTWETARPIYDPGTRDQTIANQIIVLPDGTLVDGFMHLQSQVTHHFATVKGSADVQVIRSTDEGATWSKRAISVAPVNAIGESDPQPINCRPFITGNPPCTIVRSDGVIIDLAVDSSATSDHKGRLYVTWQDHQDNPHGDDLILLSYSDDGGQSWTGPIKANDTPSDTFTDQAFEPTVHVNDQGVVAVSYYDFRNDVSGDGQLTTNHWIAHSYDGGATWESTQVDRSFDLHQTPYARGYFVGDYQGVDSQGSAFRLLSTLGSQNQANPFPNPNPTDEFLFSAS